MASYMKHDSHILVYLLQVMGLCLGQYSLTFSPSAGIHQIYDIIPIECGASNTTLQYMNSNNDSNFYIGIRYDKSQVVSRNIASLTFSESAAYTTNETLYFQLDTAHMMSSNQSINSTTQDESLFMNFTFTAEMVNIGYGQIYISLLERRAQGANVTLTSVVYAMTSVREERIVDVGFNMVVGILAVLNTFAIGCVSEFKSLKNAVKQRVRLLTALVVQFLIIPLVTFGLGQGLDVQNELALGFLFVACIPGGGLGHLVVCITGNTDREFSVLLNTLQLTVPIALMPLYIFSMQGLFLNGSGRVIGPSSYLVLWLIGLLLPFAVGVLVRHKKSNMANGFLNWLIMPFLLLAFILFITLGLYINMYIFSVLDTAALVTGGIIPFIGFGIGGALMFITRQGKIPAKTFAIVSTIPNSILAITAIRFTISQPDADLMSAAVMWVLFLTPVPLVLMFIFHRIKKKIKFQCMKKTLKEKQKMTMLTSFAAITHNAMQMGGLDRGMNTDSVKPDQTNCNSTESRMLLSQSQSFNDQPLALTNNANSSINSPAEETSIEVPTTTKN